MSLSICDRVVISLPMVIIPMESLYMSGSLPVQAWGKKHCIALAVAARQDRR